MPTNIPSPSDTEHLRSVAERTKELNSDLLALGNSLFQRDSVMQLASDAVVATDLAEAIGVLLTSVSRISDRLGEVQRLAMTLDRLVDPQLLETVR